MLIRSDRRYRFPAPPERFWDVISDVDAYRGWWPWLRRFSAERLAAGEDWQCTVKPPLPYALRFTVTLDEVEQGGGQRTIRARVHGDVRGEAWVEVADHPEGCEVRLVSSLAPGSRWLSRVAAVAAPMVRRGHDWVLDTGARQLGSRAFGTRT